MFRFRKYAWLFLAYASVCFASLSSSEAEAQSCFASISDCTIVGGFTLYAGQSLQVGTMAFAMRTDGNLVLTQAGAVLWASSQLPAQDAFPFSGPTQGLNCVNCFATFQTDGNLVLYEPVADGSSLPYWASNTPKNIGATLRLSYANPLSIVSASGSVLWTADLSATAGASSGNPVSFASTGSNSLDNTAVAMSGGPAGIGVDPLDQLMGQLWNGTAHLQPVVNMQIQTTPASGLSFVDGMDEGTRIVAANGAWYMFSREYNFAPNPIQCTNDFSRIVVRNSADHGKSWSSEVVIAEPNLALGECALADGHAYWDTDTGTWHYLVQALTSDGIWNIDHFSLQSPNPMASFVADSANPVVRSGTLWGVICGPAKSCPSGTMDEGTPEISAKSSGLYYVTFHGVNVGAGSPQIVTGYRGIAATSDFHAWMTSGAGLPGDAIWSFKDCQGWSVSWSPSTGCVGGGDASSMIASQHTYMLIESSDISVGCVAGQNWAIGLVRGPAFVASGQWEQLPSNPLMSAGNGAPCAIQYPSLFKDSGQVYASYWTLGPKGAGDPNTYFHIARLRAN